MPRRLRTQYKIENRGYSSPCWIWLGGLNKGYGRIWVGSERLGAHKYYWMKKNGPVPDGLQIDHLCRQRDCVNPDHMEAVTLATNIRRGDLAAITEETARKIKIDLADGIDRKEAEEKYGVSKSIINHIRSERRWKGV